MKKLSRICWPLLLLMACRNDPKKLAIDPWSNYRKAYQFINTNRDSAFYYFNRSASGSTDKQQVALAYRAMAVIQSDAGDYYGAQESLTLSLKSLDDKLPVDRSKFGVDYYELGSTFANLDNSTQALTYYQLALQYTDDPGLKSYILNNQGNAYKDKKSYPQAVDSYDAALALIEKKDDLYARILTNLAIAKWMWHKKYNPLPVLRTALAIRLQMNDTWGLNSSYAHLAEYFMDSRPDSALWYAQKMLVVANRLHSADDQLNALQKLVLLAPSAQLKKYFRRYKSLNDSLEAKRNAAKNQFAVIRYNVETAKAENLTLQKKNDQKRYELITVISIAVLSAILAIRWYRKRKQRMRLLAEKEIQDSQLQMSQKVHDKVANGIYSIMSEVEHNPELNRTELIDKLDIIYEVSRNIAHDETGPGGDFTKRIGSLLNAFKRSSIRLAITGNEAQLWEMVSIDAKQQLELVLQELMVNMSKHSKAGQAHVRFFIEDNMLKIECQDDGVGMSHFGKQGKGLKNTVSRIKRLDGSVTFDNQAAKGFCIHIQLPLA